MKHIERITINDARRLGKNIEIDFGSGATIILASNGTGKTTIFEAIELALTGAVKRIVNFPDAIVRNGLSEMSVRLDFSEDKYCQVKYTRGRGCIKEGAYEELFGIENNESLPYLFRLTHFLEQSCKEWLVEQEEKIAGDRISQLPIGKDLINIISKKTSFVRAIGIIENNMEKDLNEAKKDLCRFEELIAKRDGLNTITMLSPLEKIVSKLLPVSKLINYDEYNNQHKVELINAYYQKVRVLLKQETDIKKNLVIRLSALKERLSLYSSNLQLLSSKQIHISNHIDKKTKLRLIIEQTQKEIQSTKDSLSSIKDEIKQLNSVKSMFEEIEQKREALIINKAGLEQNEKMLDKLKKSYEVTIEYLKKNERLLDQHKFLDEALEKNKNLLTQIELKKEFQKQWQNISNINQEIIKKISKIEIIKSECLVSKVHVENDVSEAEKAYLQKKIILESLNKAAGVIQDAVSNIRKHLDENQRFCPVCQAKYEPIDLINRIEVSLITLNPAIPTAIMEEKNALAYLEVVKEKRYKENEKIFKIDSALNAERDRLEANKKQISDFFLPQFPGLRTPEEAEAYIEKQIAQIGSQINELEANRSQLEPKVTIEEIDHANLQKSEDERSINELTIKNINLQNEIKNQIVDINSINESISGKEKKVLLGDISSKSIQELAKIDSIQKLDASLSRNEKELKECEDSLLTENETISKIKGIQESICTEWRQAELEGQPNENELKTKYEVLSTAIDKLEEANVNLNIIEQDLASWRTAEKLQETENDIKKQIGDNYSEKTYLEFLKNSLDKKNNRLLKIQDKKNAANFFLSKVTSESQQVYDQLNSINEPWKRLLRRIVINPLISTAPLLSNSTFRNKPIAKTSATIHKQNTDIANIASEAQLTDLQLTLMLSMANKYHWTPWKALLLDDPTQHHDLVHASSVFDVLRDYIIDLDYQVMMSTHDSVQARFFQRKLENEGVPSKIYQLVARKDGVTAELMI